MAMATTTKGPSYPRHEVVIVGWGYLLLRNYVQVLVTFDFRRHEVECALRRQSRLNQHSTITWNPRQNLLCERRVRSHHLSVLRTQNP